MWDIERDSRSSGCENGLGQLEKAIRFLEHERREFCGQNVNGKCGS
jgi:hypothetical protein